MEILKKNQVDLVKYPDMSKIEEPILKQLVDKEREWWGYKGYAEYLICSDINCRALQSIDEVYGVNNQEKYVPLHELEKNGALMPPCPECGEKSEFFLEPDLFLEYLQYYFSQGVYGILLIDQNGEVQGESNVVQGQTRDIIENVMNYRLSYNIDECLQKISTLLKDVFHTDDKGEVVCLNKMALSPFLKGKNFLADLDKETLAMHPEYDELPVVNDTRFDTKLYPVFRAIGFQDVEIDNHGHVLGLFNNYKEKRSISNLSPTDFKKQFKNNLKIAKEEQKKLVAKFNPENTRKKYTGMPTLEEMKATLNKSDENIDASVENIRKASTKLNTPPIKKKKIEQETPCKIENLTSIELSPEIIKNIADFYRYIFCNAFKQYIFYPPNETEKKQIPKAISPKDFFTQHNIPFSDSEYIDLELLDKIDLNDSRFKKNGKQPMFWHHPEKTFENLQHKLSKNAHVTLLRHQDTNEIMGLIFGHKCSVKEEFETEEWQNPLYYSCMQDKELYRCFDDYLAKLNNSIKSNPNIFENYLGDDLSLKANDDIYAWNTVAVKPEFINLENTLNMTRNFFGSIPSELREKLIVIGECQFDTTAYNMFKLANCIDVPKVLHKNQTLEKNDPLIVTRPLTDFAKTFSLPVDEFKKQLIAFTKKNR